MCLIIGHKCDLLHYYDYEQFPVHVAQLPHNDIVVHIFSPPFYSQLYLWPAPTRTGMKASRTVEIILHLAGFKNIKSKVHFWLLVMNYHVTFAFFTSKTDRLPLRQVIGSRNPHNTVKAVFKALNAVMSFNFELFFCILGFLLFLIICN